MDSLTFVWTVTVMCTLDVIALAWALAVRNFVRTPGVSATALVINIGFIAWGFWLIGGGAWKP